MTVYIEMCDVTPCRDRPLCSAHSLTESPGPAQDGNKVKGLLYGTEQQGDEIHLFADLYFLLSQGLCHVK